MTIKTIELQFETGRTSFCRYAPEVGKTFYLGPFIQVRAILSEQKSVWPRISPESALFGHHLTARIPWEMASRLFEYVETRMNGEVLPSGSCYEFAAFMIGYDESRFHATSRINKLFLNSQRLPEPLSNIPIMPPGELIIVAHPDHLAIGIEDEYGNRDPDYGDMGHGPLYVQHAAISVGTVEGHPSGHKETWVIHRTAWNGRLALDPLSAVLRGYRKSLIMHPHIWAGGSLPPEDLHLYRVMHPHLPDAN